MGFKVGERDAMLKNFDEFKPYLNKEILSADMQPCHGQLVAGALDGFRVCPRGTILVEVGRSPPRMRACHGQLVARALDGFRAWSHGIILVDVER